MRILEWLRVRFAVAFVWKRPGRTAAAIRAFQATESDGVWHLHRSLARVSDPRTRAILFTHAIEEQSHADAFVRTFRAYSEQPFAAPAYEREDLTRREGEVWRAIAYVHVGEEDATERFRLIAGALSPGPLRSSLETIVRDEDGHVDLTDQLLVRLGATPAEIRKETRRIRLARAWEAWLRSGKRVVDSLATLLLSIAYFVMGPFVGGAARRKLTERFVAYDNSKIKRLS